MASYWDPRMEMSQNGEVVRTESRTMLPPEGEELVYEDIYKLTDEQLRNADFSFKYLEETKQINETWSLQFEVDGKKAGETLYSKALQSDKRLQEQTGMTLSEINITPLSIEIPFQRDDKGSETFERVRFNNVELRAGEQILSGNTSLKMVNGEYSATDGLFAFDSPEWFKDWSNVPMTLILSGAEVTKRNMSDNWIPLPNPGVDKQEATVQMKEGFDIVYTYYWHGEDLVVESESPSPLFKGTNQSTLKIAGSDSLLWPEMNPSGPNPIGKKIEVYRNIPKNSDIQINPGVYTYKDEARDIEVQIAGEK
ncbi:hypothetical protein MNQ98_10880 [Paenibacillus sp. N3/727]|uniref:hypothetical protein n=1 Tax=Paenibacillus sp. N3/727 TaxID=2925845 RepID=UPI001F538E86|nr:hypothetical protein [Paenibacillus sp. N3/727]UNK20477.1 hypothetical protein MNQ98_10880 [Paenibacillus sp. N3/727]